MILTFVDGETTSPFYVDGYISRSVSHGQTQAAVQYMGRTYPDIYSGPFRSESWDIEAVLTKTGPIALYTFTGRFNFDDTTEVTTLREYDFAGLTLEKTDVNGFPVYGMQETDADGDPISRFGTLRCPDSEIRRFAENLRLAQGSSGSVLFDPTEDSTGKSFAGEGLQIKCKVMGEYTHDIYPARSGLHRFRFTLARINDLRREL